MIPDSIKTFPNKIIKLSYFKSLLTSFIQSNPKVKNGLIHVRKENSKILNTPDKIEEQEIKKELFKLKWHKQTYCLRNKIIRNWFIKKSNVCKHYNFICKTGCRQINCVGRIDLFL